MPDQEVINIGNMSIGYKTRKTERVVASSLNASLMSGELVTLVGRNGAGKSTLLRTICGFQKPLGGSLCYMSRKGWIPTIADFSKLVAVVFAGAVSAGSMRVRELVALGRSPYTNFMGHMRPADNRAVAAAMAAVGIEHLAERDVRTLSDGERQKCMIAKALAQDAPVIILDEPTAFLDFQSKVSLFAMLKKLAAETRKAILVSTHDLEISLQMSDKLWVLHNAELNCGTVDELSANGVLGSFLNDGAVKYNEHKKIIEIELL